MGTQVLSHSYDALRDELDKARNTLRGLNDNIRRISGRDPSEQVRGDRKRNYNRNERGTEFNPAEGGRGGFNHSPPNKRRFENKSVFNRLSVVQVRDEEIKPKLNSRIIRELPTKEEIVEAQGSDPASRARNRRMFGSLMGTLQKFCQEESRLKQKEEKKAQIEKKLEEQQVQERKNMKRERENLFNNRKRQQLEIKMLETKMNLMKEFDAWEQSKKPLANFICTKSKPRIHFLPKILDKKAQKKLEESKKEVEKQIEKRRAEVNEELAEIMTGFEASIQNLQTHDVVDNFSNGPGRMPDKHDRNWNKSIDNDDDNRSNDKSDDDDEEDDDSEDDDEDEEMLPTITIKVEKDDNALPSESPKTTNKDKEENGNEEDQRDSHVPSPVGEVKKEPSVERQAPAAV